MKKLILLLALFVAGAMCGVEEPQQERTDFDPLAQRKAPVYSLQQAPLSGPELNVAELAQGCFSIQSPQTGQYVKQYHSGGTINDGESFGFRTSDLASADRFFFKPTSFKKFLLTNRNGRYLASRLPMEPTAGTYAGPYAEWEIQAIAHGNGFRYRFYNQGVGHLLRHNYSSSNFYYIDLLNIGHNTSEHDFIFVERDGCVPHVEMAVNVNGNPDALKGDASEPIRGVVDAHTHISSYEFMGGRFIHGYPFHPYGVETALNNSDSIHGPWGALDLIGNIFAFNDINHRYDTRGWPEFPHWPNHKTVSHTGYYYKWMERAWLGGVRMIVSHMVENKVLCKAQSTINPASWINPNSCEYRDSVRLQIGRHYEMQDYIDAQYGGPGKGWFRIVKSPGEAREVIADGKMAILMGIEISEIFDCGVQSKNCTLARVEAEMQEMYNMGIRSFFPTHRFDNLIAGSEVEGGFLNFGQGLSAGYMFDVEECRPETQGASLSSDDPLLDIPIIGDIFGSILGGMPNYDPAQRSCNQQGLTELGVYIVNRMIDMGFLIELDHTSDRTARKILEIAQARQYSGVISAHSRMQHGRDGQLHPNMKLLMSLGGFTAPYNNETYAMTDRVERYLNEVENTPYLNSVGIGTDMSGLGQQAGPRSDAAQNPLQYPFTSEFGLVFDRQVSGNRTMDYNTEGVAHYGLVADHIQDIRERASARVYEAIMNSAEGYVQMWERAEANETTEHFNPLELKVVIVNRHSGKCLGVIGDDDQVAAGTLVEQENCDHKQQDQRWFYDSTGNLRSAVDKDLCADARETRNNGNVMLQQCSSDPLTRWMYDGYTLQNFANPNYVLDATKGNNNVQMWGHHNDWNQQWELRAERKVRTWLTFRSAQGNGCLTVTDENLHNGVGLKMDACDNSDAQLFYYDGVAGTIRQSIDSNFCVDIPHADASQGNHPFMWTCHGRQNQRWRAVVQGGTGGIDYTFAIGSHWEQVQGSGVDVTVASDGETWHTNAAGGIYRWNGNSWNQIPGALVRISAGSMDHVWGVNGSGSIYRRNGSSWEQVPGAATDISVGVDGEVWHVNSDHKIYRYTGNNSWTQISGRLRQISVGSADQIWGVNRHNEVYRRVGNDWHRQNVTLKHVSVGDDGRVVGITPDDHIMVLVDSRWLRVDGSAVMASIATTGGDMWIVNAQGELWRRTH